MKRNRSDAVVKQMEVVFLLHLPTRPTPKGAFSYYIQSSSEYQRRAEARRSHTRERSAGSEAKRPSFVTVHVELPGFSTPRLTMQRCAARAATMTPNPPVSLLTSSATSRVSRSCTCSLRECRVTERL